jgi:hypothetical protein
MGDIFCPTCREPWDAYHLRHDEVWDTDLSRHAAKVYSEGGCQPFTKEVREALERAGWKFPAGATSVLAFIGCPCCKENIEENGPPDPGKQADKIAMREALCEILGDDQDGLQNELEDWGI